MGSLNACCEASQSTSIHSKMYPPSGLFPSHVRSWCVCDRFKFQIFLKLSFDTFESNRTAVNCYVCDNNYQTYFLYLGVHSLARYIIERWTNVYGSKYQCGKMGGTILPTFHLDHVIDDNV